MAHFAELDINNRVIRVVVISNDEVDANGGDLHADAEAFVETIVPFLPFGGTWKQTSYNHSFRKQYGGIDFTYDATKDKFISPKPYASWALNASDDWQAPVTVPTITEINSLLVIRSWDEDNLQWLGKTDNFSTNPTTTTNYTWNASGLAWTEV